MSHSYHEGPEDAVLFDGCAECDDRAANPLDGLLTLDETNMSRLLERVLNVEYGRSDNPGLLPDEMDHCYRTDNEARLGKALYRLLVLAERYPWVVER